jgi:hypothetical protein
VRASSSGPANNRPSISPLIKEPTLSINTSNRVQPVTYEVIESRPLDSTVDPDQIAIVGRTNEGITLLLSPAAAGVAAQLLIRYEALVAAARKGDILVDERAGVDITSVEGYDSDLWAHIAIDLLSARAMTLGAAALGQEVVYARAASGYLPPKPNRRLDLVAAGPQIARTNEPDQASVPSAQEVWQV